MFEGIEERWTDMASRQTIAHRSKLTLMRYHILPPLQDPYQELSVSSLAYLPVCYVR